MKFLACALLTVIATSQAFAEAPRIGAARQALDDGIPQVAIFKLRQPGKWSSKSEKATADLLLGRAMLAAGRYEESVAIMEKIASLEPEATFWLAEAWAAQTQPEKSLPLYQAVAADSPYFGPSVVGAARMLRLLNRSPEGIAALMAHQEKDPDFNPVSLELAEFQIDANDSDAATKSLALIKNPTLEQKQNAEYLSARALLLSRDNHAAEAKLKAIKDPSGRLAAGIKIALAECRLRAKDPIEGEKDLEQFIDANPRLPGLSDVFATLDRIYASESAPSSAELRKWSDNPEAPTRAALALYYQARNEVRSGRTEKGRQLYESFLVANPDHVLANPARTELAAIYLAAGNGEAALRILRAGQGARIEFMIGQAQTDLGQYKQAALSFLRSSKSPEFREEALSNSALCSILADVPEKQNQAVQQLQKEVGHEHLLERIAFYEALHQASQRKPAAADSLRRIADGDSSCASQARLALAEWDNLESDQDDAQAEILRITSGASSDPARVAYLAVFLADTGEPDSEAKVGVLAQSFLQDHPGSAFEPDVRMKMGEMLYRRGNYLDARGQFAIVTEKFPDSPLAEKALFLSAQSLARSMNPEAMEQALETYNEVVKDGGPLTARARLSQAMLFNALKRPKDALGVLESILAAKPESDFRCMALIEQGDTYFSLGSQDPQNFNKAIAAWKGITDDPNASKEWSHQALVKMGAANAKLGNSDAALDCYYGVFSKDQKDTPEYFWYYKAGFDAGRLLESQNLWKEAIAVYEKIGSVEGPRAEEARDNVNKLASGKLHLGELVIPRIMHTKLFIPGPVEVSEKTYRAMCEPMIGHRSGDFKDLYAGLQPKLQTLFGTTRPVFLSTSSAWGVMEGSIRNLVGKKVLNGMCGAFSDKWLDVSKRCGKSAEGLQVDWGQPIRSEQIEKKLSEGGFDAFTLIHNETSCGVRNSLPEIAAVMRKFPDVMFIVDTVSSFSTEPISMDELGIDVLLTGSQKALAMPPGLAIFSVSERAMARAQTIEARGYYFDFVEFAKNQSEDMTPSTPVIPLIYALRSKLNDIFAEGVEVRHARHGKLNALVHDWVRSRGFEFFAPEGYRSLSLTCVKNNREVDVAAWIKRLREKHHMVIDGGYGKIKGKTFRISNMGDETEETICTLLTALDDTLGS